MSVLEQVGGIRSLGYATGLIVTSINVSSSSVIVEKWCARRESNPHLRLRRPRNYIRQPPKISTIVYHKDFDTLAINYLIMIK